MLLHVILKIAFILINWFYRGVSIMSVNYLKLNFLQNQLTTLTTLAENFDLYACDGPEYASVEGAKSV